MDLHPSPPPTSGNLSPDAIFPPRLKELIRDGSYMKEEAIVMFRAPMAEQGIEAVINGIERLMPLTTDDKIAFGDLVAEDLRSQEGEEVQAEGHAFKLKGLADIREGLQGPQYLIKPYLERQVTCVMFGESGAYKSFVALDLGLCIAYGIDYHGHHVQQGAVVYICGEGSGGVARRIEAWLMDHNLTDRDAPFYVSTIPAELISEDNAETVASVIKDACDNPALIIIDTLSTNIGEGDESSNPDIAKLMKRVNFYFRDQFNSATLIVHHVGHGAGDRERGAYAIRANADSRIQIKKDPGYSCSMHCMKMKDAVDFDPVAFDARVVTIPGVFDSEGEAVTSLVLDKGIYVEQAKKEEIPKLQKRALECLEEMLEAVIKGSRLTTASWRDKMVKDGISKTRQAFHQLKTRMIDKGLIVESDGFVALPEVLDDPF